MGPGLRSLGVLAAVLACVLKLADAQDALSDWRQGIATFYGGAPDGMSPYDYSYGTSIGSCGYGKLDKTKYPYWSVGALSTSSTYYTSGPVQGCGECFEVECLQNAGQFAGRCNQDPNARTITIMITDCCPECGPNHIDIQALTFNKMAPMAGGRVDMRYRRVACTPPSDMSVIVDNNRGAGGWIRLQVKDVANRGAVKLVQVKGSDTDWESMNNVWGASWESTSIPKPPLDFRIQDDTGVELTAFGVVKANGETGTLPTGINFQFGPTPGPSSSSSSSASASTNSQPQVTAFQGPSSSSSDGGISQPSPPPPYWMQSPPPPPYWMQPPPPPNWMQPPPASPPPYWFQQPPSQQGYSPSGAPPPSMLSPPPLQWMQSPPPAQPQSMSTFHALSPSSSPPPAVAAQSGPGVPSTIKPGITITTASLLAGVSTATISIIGADLDATQSPSFLTTATTDIFLSTAASSPGPPSAINIFLSTATSSPGSPSTTNKLSSTTATTTSSSPLPATPLLDEPPATTRQQSTSQHTTSGTSAASASSSNKLDPTQFPSKPPTPTPAATAHILADSVPSAAAASPTTAGLGVGMVRTLQSPSSTTAATPSTTAAVLSLQQPAPACMRGQSTGAVRKLMANVNGLLESNF
ncbi:probable Expansin-A7 at N-terminal half [Coccomyxa sp. Obi]|nr:probable Expansin-A7 at N-terminal half [Coccomyxa sp. Obi]